MALDDVKLLLFILSPFIACIIILLLWRIMEKICNYVNSIYINMLNEERLNQKLINNSKKSNNPLYYDAYKSENINFKRQVLYDIFFFFNSLISIQKTKIE